MIYKLETFCDETGAKVNRRTIVSDGFIQIPKPDEKVPEFTGCAMITMMTPMGPSEEPIEFPIQAKTLPEAFAKFRPTAKEAATKVAEAQKAAQEEYEAEVRKQQLAAPATQAEKKSLLMP